jgi:predicted amidophosphoribosyltransferase
MEEDTKYIGVRVPVSLYHKLKKIAHEKQTTLTEIAIESFNQYTSNTTPGLCSHCHTQNPPDSQYCQQCGEPLTAEAAESIQTELKSLRHTVSILDQRLKIIERMEQHLKEQGDKS